MGKKILGTSECLDVRTSEKRNWIRKLGMHSPPPPVFLQKSAEGIEKEGDEFLVSAKECASA
jgi:hypothetical protein